MVMLHQHQTRWVSFFHHSDLENDSKHCDIHAWTFIPTFWKYAFVLQNWCQRFESDNTLEWCKKITRSKQKLTLRLSSQKHLRWWTEPKMRLGKIVKKRPSKNFKFHFWWPAPSAGENAAARGSQRCSEPQAAQNPHRPWKRSDEWDWSANFAKTSPGTSRNYRRRVSSHNCITLRY